MGGLFISAHPGGKKAGTLSLRCCRRLRAASQTAAAVINPRVMFWVGVLVLQLWLIRTLFAQHAFARPIPVTDRALQAWNASCAGGMAARLSAAANGEIVDVGSSEGRYFIVPRVCVSAHAGGAPWLPAAALSEAGRAQLAALAAPGTDGGLRLPSVRVGQAAGGAEAEGSWENFQLLVREGAGSALAATDGSAALAAAVLGASGEAPAVIAAPPPPGGRAFNAAGYALAGSWLRLGGLLRVTTSQPFHPWLVPPLPAPSSTDAQPPGGVGAVDALFRSAQPLQGSSSRCFGPAVIGGGSRAAAAAEHALLREALLLQSQRQRPASRGARSRGSSGGGPLRLLVAGPSSPLAEGATAVVHAVSAAIAEACAAAPDADGAASPLADTARDDSAGPSAAAAAAIARRFPTARAAFCGGAASPPVRLDVATLSGSDALPVTELAAEVGAADVLVALHGAAAALGALVRPGGALVDAAVPSYDGGQEDAAAPACVVWGLSHWRPAAGGSDVSAAALAEAVVGAALEVLGAADSGAAVAGGLRVCGAAEEAPLATGCD